MKKQIYRIIHELDSIRENKPRLESSLGESILKWEGISKKANSFSVNLRELSTDYSSRRKRKYKHKLEDYWDGEKIKEFDNLIDVLGLNEEEEAGFGLTFPANEKILAAIKKGTLIKKDDKIKIIPNHNDEIFAGAFAGGIIGGLVGLASGLVAVSPILFYLNYKDIPITEAHMATLMFVPGTIIGTVGGGIWGIRYGLKEASIENPFNEIASKIDERVEYISKFIKSYKEK